MVNASDPEEIRIALAEDQEIIELRCAQTERESVVGNVYLAVVRKVQEGLDAAFLDFGDQRSGFLHVGNVHPACLDADLSAVEIATTPIRKHAYEAPLAQPESAEETATEGDCDAEASSELAALPEPESQPSIGELLQPGRAVLVQVLRDPVRGKGATLSMHLSLAGFCLVWMPTMGRIGVSRRIEETEERDRLREILLELGNGEELPVIARTSAMGQSKKILERDLRRLQQRWNTITRDFAKAKPPCLALAEETTAVRACRELFHGGVEEIICDDPATSQALRNFLKEKGADERVKLTEHPAGKALFEAQGLEARFQSLFRSRVPIGNGASIVIHETEALVAIDVNSGPSGTGSLEQTALETNLLAAKEVACQVRLRDLGGILVVDFIDMAEPANRHKVEQTLRGFLQEDRARMKTGRLGSFGLMTFTRRRQGTGPAKGTESMCRGCGGSGNIAHHKAGALRILRKLRAMEMPSKMRVRAQPGVVQQWKRLHKPLEGLEHQVELVEDSQVSSGDSVIEHLGTLA
ncbi:MAG: Rne/Rng family ribonuclease [Planctomycetota bacterium]|nr:Rne/Rng family ribonuclease [Planctomycetota bacterium]MDA1112859.1 Rne/Rng family ribonuclease [Planctomycetota bacterium]